MNFRKILVLGCLCSASFFIACNQQPTEAVGSSSETSETEANKELEMYEASELASLMRKMYEDNLDIRKQIINGELPGGFPEEFKTIHTATPSDPKEIDETFDKLAEQYINNMQAIADAQNKEEATAAYNSMVGTCASCHQIYCQGPLAKIKKMRIANLDL